MSPDTSILEHELRRQIASLTEENERLQGGYQKMVSAALSCVPSAGEGHPFDRLDPPWIVISRLAAERDRAVERARVFEELFNLAEAIPHMTDEQLAELKHRALAASLQPKIPDHQPLDSEAKT